MKRSNPFTPVSLSRDARPIVLKRDRRAVDIEEHLTEPKTSGRIGGDHLHLRTIVVLIITALFLIAARVAYLQVAKGNEYRLRSERNRIRLEILRAPRGILFDRSHQPLLSNVPNFTLYATPADLPRSREERGAIADKLADTFPGLNRVTTRTMLDAATLGSLQPIVLAERIDHQDAIRLSTAIARIPGISLEAVSTRMYLTGESTAHLVGYLGKPTKEELAAHPNLSPFTEVGRMGIELTYDELLRGVDGVREVERDHLNKELSVVASKAAVPGKNLVLAIDRGFQEILASSLAETVERLRVPGGAAVAIDPRNGEILALVSQPSFDPNRFTEGGSVESFHALFTDERHPLFFRPVSGAYPSGSTIKPVIAAAGLAEGIITDRTTIQSIGGLQVGPNFFPDWKSGGHGTTDVRKALSESVNTFFYMVGGGFEDFRGLGIDRMVDHLQRFGLGRTLGIDAPDEATGFLPTREWRERPESPRWYLGDTYHLAIGQGYINVTPLQVASYTAAIANGGTLYQPHIVREILNTDGSTDTIMPPSIIGTTIPDRFLETVRSGMRQAVTSGSARALGSVPVAVAAKTGTAQVGEGDTTHAWLTSFAPYERPEIVITVVIENGGEGHATALPVARRALEWYFRNPRNSS